MSWENKQHLGYDYNHNHIYNPPPPPQFYNPPAPAPGHPPMELLNQNYNCGYSTRTYYEQYRCCVHQPPKKISNNYANFPPHSAQGYSLPNTHPRQESQNFDAQEEFKEKLIAYARYNRNNDLIKTVVSGVVIPQINGIVTVTRVKALTNQVNALSSHEKVVSKEILEIEENHLVRKRKFQDTCDNFWRKYQKLSEPPVDTESYTLLVNKYYGDLKQNLELQRWQKTLAWAHETIAATTNPAVASAKTSKPLLAEILAAPTRYHPQVSNNHHSGGELQLTT